MKNSLFQFDFKTKKNHFHISSIYEYKLKYQADFKRKSG